MLEKSKEIKFGKPGRSRKESGSTPSNKGLVQSTKKGGVHAFRLPNGNVVMKGSYEYLNAKALYTSQTKKRDEWKAYKNRSQTEINKDNAKASTDAAKAANKDAKNSESTDATATPPSSSSNLTVPAKNTPADKDINVKDNLAAGEKAKKIEADKRAKEDAAEKARIDAIPDNPADKDKNPNAVKYSDKEGEPVSNLKDRRSTSQNKETTDANKSNPYADAKKKDSKIDSYIKIRNNSKKGSSEYNAAQNKINAAYGKGPQRKVDIKPVKAQEAKPIERKSTPAKSIQTSSKTSSKPASKSASSSSNRNNTGGGSGMGGIQSGKDKLKNLGITTESDTKLPPSLSNREKRQNKREKKKEIRKDARNKIREIKGKPAKASYGMSKKYGKGGRKRAIVGVGLGALTGALGSIGSGEGVKGVLKGAATGAVNSVVPGVGTALGGAVGGKTPAPAAGAGANAPVDPAPVTPPVDPNATVQAQKGRMRDRRKARQAARKYNRSARRRNRNNGTGGLSLPKLGRSGKNCIKGDC